MKIVLEVPDKAKCLNVCVVYDDGAYPAMAMASTMRGTDDLHDGAVFHIPNKEGDEEE